MGIDAGNSEVKAVTYEGIGKFTSEIGEYRELNLKQRHGKDDMVWEYEGRRGFAGSLAKYESEFCGSMMGESKAHDDAKLRVLLAIARFTGQESVKIVVGQPISHHTENEKARIISMLKGSHSIKVNGEPKHFVISDVAVAAEGGAAFWAKPERGLIRIVDAGSGTVNCATLIDKRYVDRDSFTLPFGVATTKTSDPQALARAICAAASKKWEKNDSIHIIGGAAEELEPHMRHYFPQARAFYPAGSAHPVYANAIGFFEIGRRLFER